MLVPGVGAGQGGSQGSGGGRPAPAVDLRANQFAMEVMAQNREPTAARLVAAEPRVEISFTEAQRIIEKIVDAVVAKVSTKASTVDEEALFLDLIEKGRRGLVGECGDASPIVYAEGTEIPPIPNQMIALFAWLSVIMHERCPEGSCLPFMIRILSSPQFSDENSKGGIYTLLRQVITETNQWTKKNPWFHLRWGLFFQALNHLVKHQLSPAILGAYALHEYHLFRTDYSENKMPEFHLSSERFKALEELLHTQSLDRMALESLLYLVLRTHARTTIISHALAPQEISFVLIWLERMFQCNPSWIPPLGLVECPNFDKLWPFIVPYLKLDETTKDFETLRSFTTHLALCHPSLELPLPFLEAMARVASKENASHLYFPCMHFFCRAKFLEIFKPSATPISISSLLTREGNEDRALPLWLRTQFKGDNEFRPTDVLEALLTLTNLLRNGYIPVTRDLPNSAALHSFLHEMYLYWDYQARLLNIDYNYQAALAWKQGRKGTQTLLQLIPMLAPDQLAEREIILLHKLVKKLCTAYRCQEDGLIFYATASQIPSSTVLTAQIVLLIENLHATTHSARISAIQALLKLHSQCGPLNENCILALNDLIRDPVQRKFWTFRLDERPLLIKFVNTFDLLASTEDVPLRKLLCDDQTTQFDFARENTQAYATKT